MPILPDVEYQPERATCGVCRQQVQVTHRYHGYPSIPWVGIATHLSNGSWCPQREAFAPPDTSQEDGYDGPCWGPTAEDRYQAYANLTERDAAAALDIEEPLDVANRSAAVARWHALVSRIDAEVALRREAERERDELADRVITLETDIAHGLTIEAADMAAEVQRLRGALERLVNAERMGAVTTVGPAGREFSQALEIAAAALESHH